MPHATPRFVWTRVFGLAALLWLYSALDFPGRGPSPKVLGPSSTSAQESPQTGQLAALAGGIEDATDALQALIDALPDAAGRLLIPPRTYRISRPLIFELDKIGPVAILGDGNVRLIMDGPGPALHIIGTHGGTAAPETVKPNVWERQRMPLVDGIEIVGRDPQACGIELTGTMQATITRVTVRDALHGIHLTTRNRNVQISDCHLYDNKGVGLYLDGVNLHQINVVGCHISYNDQGGIVCRNSEVRNLQIGTCDIEANMALNGPPSANILFDCRSGSVREAAIVGCTIQHDHDAPDSANIRLLGQSPEVADKVGNLVISDNVFSDVQWNIHMQYARGLTLTGNTFWHGQAGNVLVENSSNIVVGPNLFDRNPDYGREDDGSTNALIFRNCRDCTLTGLHVNNVLDSPAAIALERCRWFNITGCSVLDCDGAGIELSHCEHCSIANCLIRDERHAIGELVAVHVEGGEDVRVGENAVYGKVIR